MTNGQLPSDFLANVRKSGNGCWHWTGKVDSNGYGVYRGKAAHRVACAAFQVIPPGHVVDHTCHTQRCTARGRVDPHRRCVNPAHLEPVTNAENVRRGRWEAAKAETKAKAGLCQKGHDKPGKTCNTCTRERRAAQRAARQEARAKWGRKI